MKKKKRYKNIFVFKLNKKYYFILLKRIFYINPHISKNNNYIK